MGDRQDDLWDEEDGFFYDVLRLPDGSARRLKVRSMVGLLPLCAATVFEPGELSRVPDAVDRGAALPRPLPPSGGTYPAAHQAGPWRPHPAGGARRDAAAPDPARMLDENEFLSPFGIRSLSRYHHDHPFMFDVGGREYRVAYSPAESLSGSFGGNSNWRGPVWMPVNILIVRSLINLHRYYGEDFKVECPTGSGRLANAPPGRAGAGPAGSSRSSGRGPDGTRPLYGGSEKFQTDPHWRDLILFYEYFHGDNGAGIGASHQTGWTGDVSLLSMLTGSADVMTSASDGSRDQFFAALGRIRDRGSSN